MPDQEPKRFSFKCPACKKILKSQAEKKGAGFKCSGCEVRLVVPAPGSEFAEKPKEAKKPSTQDEEETLWEGKGEAKKSLSQMMAAGWSLFIAVGWCIMAQINPSYAWVPMPCFWTAIGVTGLGMIIAIVRYDSSTLSWCKITNRKTVYVQGSRKIKINHRDVEKVALRKAFDFTSNRETVTIHIVVEAKSGEVIDFETDFDEEELTKLCEELFKEKFTRKERTAPSKPPKSFEGNEPCPKCGKPLRSNTAMQCFECGANWHDKTD